MTQGNPFWSQARQYQQRQQSRGQVGPQRQSGKQQHQQQGRLREDFGDDWRGRHVITRVAEGASVSTIEGIVEDVSRYWIKLRVGNEVLYVNKAHIVSIKSVEIKDGSGVTGNENGR